MGPAAKNDHLAALEAQVAEKRRLNEQNAARDKQELLHHYANYSLGADDGCVLFCFGRVSPLSVRTSRPVVFCRAAKGLYSHINAAQSKLDVATRHIAATTSESVSQAFVPDSSAVLTDKSGLCVFPFGLMSWRCVRQRD